MPITNTQRERLPAVEFLAVCNKDPITEGTGVQIGEFDANSVIAHAAGEELRVSGLIEDNGESILFVKATSDDVLNLDTLITTKDVEIT